MGISIAAQVIPQGLLIPRAAIQEWLERGVEVIKERDEERIVIQPKPAPRGERERVLQILEGSGLLVKPQWEPTSPPVSSAERAELAKKFSVGRPLSEIVIEEREERW